MPISRKKSCARCRQSKLRCNLDIPSCSQCTKRGYRCIYDGRDSERVAPYSFQTQTQTQTTAAVSHLSISVDELAGVDILEHPDITSGMATSFSATAANDEGLDMPDGGLPFDWMDIGAPAYLGLETPKSFGLSIKELPSVSSEGFFSAAHQQHDLSTLDTQLQHSQHGSTMNAERAQTASMADNAQLISITKPSGQKILRRRTFLNDCVLTSVVLGQLTGYPKMMLTGDLLPPFIQPPCHFDEEQAPECRAAGRHKCLPEILAICVGLVEMFYSRTQANERFVWETIFAEQARLRKKFATFDRHEQLAAVQSITIFMLLQADDLSTVDRNDAGALLSTAMEFIIIMSSRHKWHANMSRVRPVRREWAFVESLKRIASIFCIIDLLLEGIPSPDGHMCEAGVAFAQGFLPCSRNIWEARSTSDWIMHYDNYLQRRESDEDLRGQHLLESKLSSSHSGVHKSCMGSVVKSPHSDVLQWCEGLDMLGTLIWMVVPLYQYRIEQGIS